MTKDYLTGDLQLFGRSEDELIQLEAENPVAFARAVSESLSVAPQLQDWKNMLVVQPQITDLKTLGPGAETEIAMPRIDPAMQILLNVTSPRVSVRGTAAPVAVVTKQGLFDDLIGTHFDRSDYVEGHVPVFDLAMAQDFNPVVKSRISHHASETLKTALSLKFPGFGGSNANTLTVSTSVDFSANGAFQLACTALFRVDRYHNPAKGTVKHKVYLEEVRTPVFQCRAGDAEYTPLSIGDWRGRKIGSTFQPLKQVVSVDQSGTLSADVTVPLGDKDAGASLGLSCSIETQTELKLTLDRAKEELLYLDISQQNPLAMRLRSLPGAGV